MGRKASSRKNAVLMSTLVRAEDAAEEEILETPAVSRLAPEHESKEEEEDDEEEEEEDEDEIERRLVEEQLLEQEKQESKSIYNREALSKILQDWNHGQSCLPWIETLETCDVPLELENVHDDLKREVAFYTNSVASVRLAKAKLLQLGISYKRPMDYFAEMLKSDAHMAKVKDKLIYEQKKIHAVEERKKSQAHRRVAKELQAEKVKQRLQQKNDTLDAVKQWKKRRNQDKGGVIRDEDDQELDAIVRGTNNGKRKRDDGKDDRGGNKKRNLKREGKDQKYGFGGKKKYAKSNTKESTNDLSRFPGRGQKEGMKRSSGGKAPKGKRMGKTQRMNKRTGNRR